VESVTTAALNTSSYYDTMSTRLLVAKAGTDRGLAGRRGGDNRSLASPFVVSAPNVANAEAKVGLSGDGHVPRGGLHWPAWRRVCCGGRRIRIRGRGSIPSLPRSAKVTAY
jgi:hypothetical protein